MKVRILRTILHARRFDEIFRKQTWVFFAVFLLTGLVLTCIIINWIEHRGIKDLYKTFETIMPFLLGEYEKLEDLGLKPESRKIVFFLFIISALILAGIFGKIVSYFVREEKKMPRRLESHIVICNWNDRGDGIIKEMHSSLDNRETEIIVVTKKAIDNEEELRSDQAYDEVYFVRGDPSSHEVLKRQRVDLARSVIILADPECEDPDAKTALISIALRHLNKDLQQKNESQSMAEKTIVPNEEDQKHPRIIAEVTSPQKGRHLEEAGVDEWVCSTDYGLKIIAQCALKPKLTEVYQQLLSYSETTNEIYLVEKHKYPDWFVNEHFTKVSEIINDNKDPENPAILLGVKREENDKTEILLNPREKDFTIKPDDVLIVMAYAQPDLSQLQRKERR
ncbi:MAG: NAD-binding protein [Candidatus Hodarchaeota archaeon]